jgi:hypothetical protein
MSYSDIYRTIYINHYGSIPKDQDGRSYEIHHIDGNNKNNNPSNLIAVSIQEHYNIHESQGDWYACLRIAAKMKISPEKLSEMSKKMNAERVANGTHHLLGGEIQRKSNAKRIAENTHNWQGSSSNKNMLSKGIHPSQIKVKCENCDKVISIANYKRWHGDRCKH